MSADPIFGPILDEGDIQAAVRDTIQRWIKTYLAAVERLNGIEPKRIPLPRSYVLKDDGSLDKRPEDQVPTVVILCPGTSDRSKIKMEGDGMYRAPWAVSVAVIVSARDQASTSDLAKWYAAAIRALIIHNGTLGGFARSTSWQGVRNDDLKPEDDRTLAVGTNVFEVLVPDIVQKGAGLKEPLEEPYEEAELPTVKEVDVVLKPEEIQ